MSNYQTTIKFWDNIFGGINPNPDIRSGRIHEELELACKWLSEGATAILDYGCGSGALLLRCITGNTHCTGLGIDIAQKAVELARETTQLNNLGKRATFVCGGAEALAGAADHSFDAAILSNIVDNVTPEDAAYILHHIHRIVKPGGKLLLKLNPFLSEQQLDEYGLTRLSDGFYLEKDGIYLRNLTDAQWETILSPRFTIHEFREIYFQEHDQTNRLYLLENKK